MEQCTYWVPHHGVGLPRACLSIGKDTGVIPLKRSCQNLTPQVLENLKKTAQIQRALCPEMEKAYSERLLNTETLVYLFLRYKAGSSYISRIIGEIKRERLPFIFYFICWDAIGYVL